MKALVCEDFGPVDDLVYREFPDPVPGEGEVLVDVDAIGVNFPDGLLVEGKYQLRPQCPFVPGSEFAGRVAALGPGASGFAVGDRVFGWHMGGGAYAERVAALTSEIHPLPASLSVEQGAALLCATGTAHHALRQRGRLQSGETLVVLGAAGGTGIGAEEMQVYAGRTIDQPSMFISGASDWGRYQSPGAYERMQERACSDMRSTPVVPGAGHWVQQEQPEATARLIRDFLSSLV